MSGEESEAKLGQLLLMVLAALRNIALSYSLPEDRKRSLYFHKGNVHELYQKLKLTYVNSNGRYHNLNEN